jgi:hypothetical protein
MDARGQGDDRVRIATRGHHDGCAISFIGKEGERVKTFIAQRG